MSVTALVFLVASSLYTGFPWTIRTVVYPQFAKVGTDDFVVYERSHRRLVSVAVGPLFGLLGLAALGVLLDPPASAPTWARFVPAVLAGSVLTITALVAVPLHRRLGDRFESGVHRRLLTVDTVRLVVALASTAVGVALVVG